MIMFTSMEEAEKWAKHPQDECHGTPEDHFVKKLQPVYDAYDFSCCQHPGEASRWLPSPTEEECAALLRWISDKGDGATYDAMNEIENHDTIKHSALSKLISEGKVTCEFADDWSEEVLFRVREV